VLILEGADVLEQALDLDVAAPISVPVAGAQPSGGADDRKRAARDAEARGEAHPETAEQVELERRQAEAEILVSRERSAALRKAEHEVNDVIDRHEEHFIAAALAASEAAADAIATAKTAAQAASTAWREAQGAWGTVRLSRRRRGLDLPPEVPISDFGNAVGELEKSQSRPFPGGSRQAWESFRDRESGQRVIRSSSSPDPEPLLERIR
jgi:hypothetical protein